MGEHQFLVTDGRGKLIESTGSGQDISLLTDQ
jgi:hypothetical protein